MIIYEPNETGFAMIRARSVFLTSRSILLFLLCFIGCKTDIDINNIEIRDHGLSYIKRQIRLLMEGWSEKQTAELWS